MKSSTIRRSTLSKESMEVIENLSKEQEMNNLPGEYYVRPEETASQEAQTSSNKSQEIDLLWQRHSKPANLVQTHLVHICSADLLQEF